MAELIRRCCVCKTIELGKDVLIPEGEYQFVNQIFSDGILSRECLRKQYEKQLPPEVLGKMLFDKGYYDSCRHHE